MNNKALTIIVVDSFLDALSCLGLADPKVNIRCDILIINTPVMFNGIVTAKNCYINEKLAPSCYENTILDIPYSHSHSIGHYVHFNNGVSCELSTKTKEEIAILIGQHCCPMDSL